MTDGPKHIHLKTGALVFGSTHNEGEVRLATAQELADREERNRMALLRQRRDELLAACDWTQLSDQPESRRVSWQAYRQALRDLPASGGAWPTPPAGA